MNEPNRFVLDLTMGKGECSAKGFMYYTVVQFLCVKIEKVDSGFESQLRYLLAV